MRDQHLRDQPAHAARADDNYPRFVGRVLGQFGDRLDTPGDDAPEPRKQRRHRKSDRGDDLPELRGSGLDQQGRACRREDDQRGLRWARHQYARFRCGAAPCAHEPQQHAGDQRLEGQDQQHRGGDEGEVLPDRLEVDAHADRDQEDAESETLEGLHDRLDFAVILGLGDEQPGDQGAHDRRKAHCGGGEAGADYHQQRCGEEQLGALGARGLAEQPG